MGCLMNFSNSAKVSSIILNGKWNCTPLSSVVPSWVLNKIHSTQILGGQNSITWLGFHSPTTKEFKDAVFEAHPNVGWSNNIWFKGNAINYVLYCWLACLDGLKTDDILAKRRIGNRSICALCHTHSETHSHLFFECPYSMKLVRALIPNGEFLLMQSTLHQILNYVDETSHSAANRLHILITAILVYSIWRERNKRIHSIIATTTSSLIPEIHSRVAAKLQRWNIKGSWPSPV